MAIGTIKNFLVRSWNRAFKDKRESQNFEYFAQAVQADLANIWAALDNITQQLDKNSVTGHPYNPTNGGGTGSGWTANTANLPSTANDQLTTNNADLVYNASGTSSLHTQP